MRVDCPNCSSKAVVSSSNKLSATVKDLYCQCTNVEGCGATFVQTTGFTRWLNPPQQTTQQLAAALINSLPAEERRALQTEMFG